MSWSRPFRISDAGGCALRIVGIATILTGGGCSQTTRNAPINWRDPETSRSLESEVALTLRDASTDGAVGAQDLAPSAVFQQMRAHAGNEDLEYIMRSSESDVARLAAYLVVAERAPSDRTRAAMISLLARRGSVMFLAAPLMYLREVKVSGETRRQIDSAISDVSLDPSRVAIVVGALPLEVLEDWFCSDRGIDMRNTFAQFVLSELWSESKKERELLAQKLNECANAGGPGLAIYVLHAPASDHGFLERLVDCIEDDAVSDELIVTICAERGDIIRSEIALGDLNVSKKRRHLLEKCVGD